MLAYSKYEYKTHLYSYLKMKINVYMEYDTLIFLLSLSRVICFTIGIQAFFKAIRYLLSNALGIIIDYLLHYLRYYRFFSGGKSRECDDLIISLHPFQGSNNLHRKTSLKCFTNCEEFSCFTKLFKLKIRPSGRLT